MKEHKNLNRKKYHLNDGDFYIYKNEFFNRGNINVPLYDFTDDTIINNFEFEGIIQLFYKNHSYYNEVLRFSNGKLYFGLNCSDNECYNRSIIKFRPNIRKGVHTNQERISKSAKRVIMTFIFRLHYESENEWAIKHDASKEIRFYIGFNDLDLFYPYDDDLLKNIMFIYSTNKTLNPTNNIMFNLFNKKYDTGIDFVEDIAKPEKATRIDIILKNDDGNSVLVEFYLNNVLRYTYLISGDDYKKLPNYYPYICIGQNNFTKDENKFAIIFDYFLAAHTKYPEEGYLNRCFDYYDDKL